MRFYTNPDDERDPFKLPDAEVWYDNGEVPSEGGEPLDPGWYVWACFPGCLPESDPWGPKPTREAAIKAWRVAMGDS